MKADPTPDEIEVRAAEVRSRWTVREERKRRVWLRPHYTIPIISILEMVSDRLTPEAEMGR